VRTSWFPEGSRTRIRAELAQGLVQVLGDQRADVGALRVEEGDDHESAPLRREPHGMPILVAKREIRRR
jgi:hypothetical protein